MISMDGEDRNEEVRLDKWLWAARFYKTRSLAADAVTGGKVAVNGERSKPSRVLNTGEMLTIRRGPYEWTVIVKEVSRLRGPAPQAHRLYEETEESLRRREAAVAQLKLEHPQGSDNAGRPSKKDRRAMAKLTRRGR
jgi:ribosome-associated heat shock protein Hsp15